MTGSVWKIGGLAAAFAVAALSAGCGSDLTAVDCQEDVRDSTEEIPEKYQGLSVSPTLIHLLITAPRDSIVMATAEPWPGPEPFTQIVEELGGEVTYMFQTFYAISIKVTVAGLDAIVLRPELYRRITIGAGPGYPLARGSSCG